MRGQLAARATFPRPQCGFGAATALFAEGWHEQDGKDNAAGAAVNER
jgi:hypothetical protein